MIAHELFPLADLEPGTARRVEVDGRPVAVIRIDDDVYAIGDTCSHAEVSLSEGWVDDEDCTIECVAHGATFDVETGEPVTLPATRPVPVYEATVVDGTVVVTVDDGRDADAGSGAAAGGGGSGADDAGSGGAAGGKGEGASGADDSGDGEGAAGS